MTDKDSRSMLIESAIQEISVYGYTKLPALIDNVHELLNLLENHHLDEIGRNKQLHEERARDKYVYNLQNKSHLFIKLLSNPLLKSIFQHFLNDPYYQVMPNSEPNYILNYFNARSSGSFLDLHIDCKVPATGKYTWVMQAAFVLEEMTEENGCTVVVPGSHKSGEYTDRKLAKRVPIQAQPGDVLLWDSRLWHGTTENVNGKSRWVAIATLTQWWIKQNLDIPRMLPQSIYEKCTPDEKILLGFCSIPPVTDKETVIMKKDKSYLKDQVSDYF